MDNNLENAIYNLVKVLKNWEDDLSKLETKYISEAMYSFNKEIIKKGNMDFPKNLFEFINFLMDKSLKDMNFDDKDFEINLLNEKIILNGRLNYKYKNWFEEMESITEEEEKAMKKFLDVCRKHRGKEDEEEYCRYYNKGRTLISKENMVISKIKFYKLIEKTLPKELRRIAESWRKDIDINEDEIKVCPVCGKRIDFNFRVEGQCSEICDYYIAKNNLKYVTKKINSSQYSEFTNGIYRFILLPGIGETNIYKNLLKYEKCKVTLYPNMDEFDIEVLYNDKKAYIDVKDVAKPNDLVSLLKENDGVSKLWKEEDRLIYLVIPEHRRSIYKDKFGVDYKKELVRILENENIEIDVLYERELYKEIDNMVDVLF